MFRKYQTVEKVEIVPEEDSERVRKGVANLGKISAAELTETEKRELLDK